jgi:hypothetical protein
MRLSPFWVLCLMLAACARDPVDNPGTWKVPDKGLNSNDQNLRAMLVNPNDLTRGRGDSTSEGVTAARAARRELAGQRAPLPNADISLSTSQSGQGGQQPQQQQGAGGGLTGGRSE